MYRLDIFLVMKGFFTSREKAKQAIIDGKVFVNEKPAKPSQKVTGEEDIKVNNAITFVSRAALKLKKSAEVFNVQFKDRVVLDIGSSTGGFTQVSLMLGAKKVIAVDVGDNQLSEKLKNDERVMLYENQDFRFIESHKIKEADLIVSDVSFISLRNIIPKIINEFGRGIEAILLFKPQFECGKEIAKKYMGVIRNKSIHLELLTSFKNYIESLGLVFSNLSYSPITGKTGNIEYLIHINGKKSAYNIKNIVEKAFENL